MRAFKYYRPAGLSESSGKQKPESFKDGERDLLANNRGEQAGLSYTATETCEEALEISAPF